MKQTIGFIGLGKMGSPMVLNLLEKKWKTIIYNRSPEPTKQLAKKGAIASYSLEELVEKLPKRKIIWIMVPQGKPVESVLHALLPLLKKGDIIIDGGNSFYQDSKKRYTNLKKKGVHFLDCGVSGGVEGARHGASMMIGGEKKIYQKSESLLKALCTKDGYGYVGSPGSGHFVKAVHNAIEYGMISALNEGFETMQHQKEMNVDLKEVAKVYDHGSIIEGRLMDWLYDSFKRPNYLDNISCEVPKGETEKEMKFFEKTFKMPVLRAARLARFHSRKGSFCGKFIAVLRNEFGGHAFKKRK